MVLKGILNGNWVDLSSGGGAGLNFLINFFEYQHYPFMIEKDLEGIISRMSYNVTYATSPSGWCRTVVVVADSDNLNKIPKRFVSSLIALTVPLIIGGSDV